LKSRRSAIKVSQLEKRLGLKLLQRTTRKVSVTEAGRQYLSYCTEALDKLQQAELAVKNLSQIPKGKLKVAMPANLLEVLMPEVLIPFMQDFTKVSLEIIQTDHSLDMIEEQFDVLIQPGSEEIDDSSFIYRKLRTSQWVLVAAKRLLDEHGLTEQSASEAIEQLPYINISNRYKTTGNVSLQVQPSSCFYQGRKLNFKSRLSVNNTVSAIEALKKGIGLSILPDTMVEKGLASGELVQCLKGLDVHKTALYLIYPSRVGQAANVKEFVERLLAWFEFKR